MTDDYRYAVKLLDDLTERITALEQQSGLMSPSIWRRAFTVLGLWVLAYVVVGAVLIAAALLLQGIGG